MLAPIESRTYSARATQHTYQSSPAKPYVENPHSFGGCRKVDDDSLIGVPAAIHAALGAISEGAKFYASADIQAFFTRIPKSEVIEIISSVTNDLEFERFLGAAVNVELSNMAELRSRAAEFPIEEIGVAQGNSLSPLLGNIYLASFDKAMNAGPGPCFRYVDDFLILGATASDVNSKLRLAKDLLRAKGMSLSPEKSSKGAQPISQGFEFLGIDVSPGLIRPTKKAQRRLTSSIKARLDASQRHYQALRKGVPLERRFALLETLRQVSGIVDGWGKHYKFCNDGNTLAHLDGCIEELLSSYLGAYSDAVRRVEGGRRRELLGIGNLAVDDSAAFTYPKQSKRRKSVAENTSQ